MKKRLPTAIILILLITPLLILNFHINDYEPFKLVFIILFGFFNSFAVYELTKIFDQRKKINLFSKILLSLASQCIYLFLLSYGLNLYSNYVDELIKVLVLLLAMLAVIIFIAINRKVLGDYKLIKILGLIIFYPALGFGALANLRIQGSIYILYIILVCALTDTFAYFTGMLLGKHKLASKISPKKTWEGSIGGTLIATLALTPIFVYYHKFLNFNRYIGDAEANIFRNTVLTSLALHYQLLILFTITLILSIIAQIGDLFASYIKRQNGIKDYSQLLPGHGGVLDRFDSLILVAMATFIFKALVWK